MLLSSLFRDLSLVLLCDLSRYLSFDGWACLLGMLAYSFSRCLSSSSKYHFGAMVWKLKVRILLSSLSNVYELNWMSSSDDAIRHWWRMDWVLK